MSSRAERYLDAFSLIESHLRRIAGTESHDTFSELIYGAASQSTVVYRYQTDLREYADLRNAIVHERTDSHPIADPYERTVRSIEQLAGLLTAPPNALATIGSRNVKTCNTDTSVADAARLMREGDFSQLPVVTDRHVTALLTAETVTRWLAAVVHEHGGVVLDDHTVSDALPHTEQPTHHWELLGRQATVFDALDRFDHYLENGWSLDALLVSETGSTGQSLLGIITVYDHPKLAGAILPKRR